MTHRTILISTIAVLLAACDRPSGVADAQRAAELERDRQEAREEIRQLKQRLDEADQQKAAQREAEFGRTKEELAQARQERVQVEEKLRLLEAQARDPREERPAPVAETSRQPTALPGRPLEEGEDSDEDPVYVGRVVPETQRVTSVNSFYEPLDPYGDWMETDDYGYVFRPHLAVRGGNWRPYTDGRWTYTDYGWTWESNEDFGWATYHYGRWAQLRGAGWVWVPGREWAPAWVSWRRGNDFCGWAPLPPESRGRVTFTAAVDRDYDLGPSAYVFVELSNFGARSYVPFIEPPVRNTTIVTKTVNVTNITYHTTNNQTVVFNGGPRYEAVRSKSKQPVDRARVSFAAAQGGASNVKMANVREGDSLKIAAPPRPGVGNAAPSKVKEKLGKAQVDKGWQGVEAGQAERVKREMAGTSVVRPTKPVRPTLTPAPLPVPVGHKVPAQPVTALPAPIQPVVTAPERVKPAEAPERPRPANRGEKPPLSTPIPEPIKPAPGVESQGPKIVPSTPVEAVKPVVPILDPVKPEHPPVERPRQDSRNENRPPAGGPNPTKPIPDHRSSAPNSGPGKTASGQVDRPRQPIQGTPPSAAERVQPIVPPPTVIVPPSESPGGPASPTGGKSPGHDNISKPAGNAAEARVRRNETQGESQGPVGPRNTGIVPPVSPQGERRPRDLQQSGNPSGGPAEDGPRNGPRPNGSGGGNQRPAQLQTPSGAGPTPQPGDPSGQKKKNKNNGGN